MASGILIVDKPEDWTSQDVVAKLRGALHERRAGHGGTLDPMATGVLPVFFGRATRAVEFFEHAEKTYEAVLRLGLVTDTQDITGRVLEQRDAACKDTGADTFAINTALFMTKRLPRLQLEARLTEEMEFYAGGAVAVNTLPNVLLVELGLTEDDVDDISGFSREIAGVEIGVMLREGPDGGKISLRCSPKYDAAAICARLGGGGHRGAAGASVPEGLDAAKKAILQAIADSGVEL